MLSDSKIPTYLFFPSDLMETEGPRHWARLRLLQACERLNIPTDRWPKFPALKVPREYGYKYRIGNTFTVPEFNPLYETEAQWRNRAMVALNEFIDEPASRFRHELQESLWQKKLIAIPQTRDTTPLDLRYEWAAKRACYNTPYRQLVTGGYNEARIKRTVSSILRQAGIQKDGKIEELPAW